MLKLRYLFKNVDLAEMLVKNWDYDAPSLEMFQDFRISANAIYPFMIHGEVCFLRGCPAEEKTGESILAELEFIDYLRGKGYPALEPVASKAGAELVQQATPWGEYYASVFKRVTGQPVDESSYADELMFAYGAALGRLHALSCEYTAPKPRRWSHLDIFNWIEGTLDDLEDETAALEELDLLREDFSGLPSNPRNYGLIHYDFEPDNVTYDRATDTCSVIDFDDAMYHWYLMDVVKTLVSLKSALATRAYAEKRAIFTAGYRSEFEIDAVLVSATPLFMRFTNLYRYTRIARATQEHGEHEPDWMLGLRAKLARMRLKDGVYFGVESSIPDLHEVW